MKFKKIEGYFRPILVQVQWCLSLLTVINTMFLVLGTPSWVKVFYGVFPILAFVWILYYFKRGRRQEFTNMHKDNPLMDEIKAAREQLKELLRR